MQIERGRAFDGVSVLNSISVKAFPMTLKPVLEERFYPFQTKGICPSRHFSLGARSATG
jgi:hypothetical protein